MKTVIYTETLERTVEVEVTDEQFEALKATSGDVYDDKREDAIAAIVKATNKIKLYDIRPEFVNAVCMHDDEELFDIG